MKKILFALVLILGIAGEARAQLGQRISTVQNSLGQPITGATVSVCAYNAGSYGFINGAWTYTGPIPCTPLVPIFADPAGVNTIAPPLLTTGIGNYTYWISSNNYTECVTGGQITGACYAVQVGGIGGGGGGTPGAPAGSVQFANATASGFASVPGFQVDSITTPTTLTIPTTLAFSVLGNMTATGQNALNIYSLNNYILVDGNKYPLSMAGISAAVTALGINPGTVLLAPGAYTDDGTTTVTVSHEGQHIVSIGGKRTTQITSASSRNVPMFVFSTGAATVLYKGELGGVTFIGAGSLQKVAIKLVDTSEFYLHDVMITGWTGATSIGLWVQGRELGSVERVSIGADRPIWIDIDPNISTENLDAWTFQDIYLLTQTTSESGILIAPGSVIYHSRFKGIDCIFGASCINWNETTAVAATSFGISFEDIHHEQATGGSYSFNFARSNAGAQTLQSVKLTNLESDIISNGIFLQRTHNVTIIDFVHARAGGTSINADNTNFNTVVVAGFLQTGSTFADTSLTASTDYNLFNSVSFVENAAGPAAIAGTDNCGGSSSTHSLQCSFNGGTPGTVALLNAAQTFTGAQTFALAPTISALANVGVQCMQVNNSGVIGLSGATCGGGGGGSSIFTQWQFGSNTALSSTGLYIQVTAPAMFNLTQSGLGTIGSPYIDTFAFASQAGGTVLNNNTGGSAVPIFTAAEILGIAASSAGTLALCNGNASGACVTQQVLTATAAYNWNYPATAGTAGQVVTSQGGGSNPMTYTSPTITIQGVACTLGVACTPLTIQTNTVNNTSQSTLNVLSSSTNSVGLTLTQTNTSAGNVKGEIAGLANPLGGGTGLSSPAAHCYLITEGINPFGTNCSPIVNGFYVCGFNVFASAQVDPTCTLQGVAIVANSGAATPLTSAANVTLQQFTSGSAQTVTGPPLASNITFDMLVTGAGGVTYTASASTCNGNATCLIPGGWFAQEFTDNSKTIMAILAGQGAFPNTTANQALTFTAATGVIGTLGNIAIGPGVSVNGDQACWNGTTGLLLSDCGALGANAVTTAVTQTSGAIAIGAGSKTLGAPLAATGNDYIVIASGAGVWTQTQVNAGADCGDATHAIKFTAATQTFACQAITGAAAAGGNANTIQWNNATALGGIVQWTTNGTTTITGSATAVLDMSAGAPVSALKLPTVAGAIPTADGFIGINSTIHALVWGSNGTTIVTAAAGTGTTASTTCSATQFISAVSSVAAPTCTTLSLTSSVTGILPVANGGLNTGTPGFSALTDGPTVTWAVASALIDSASLTFTVHSGSRTLNITGPVDGGQYTLVLIQDATGGEGLTLGTGCTWKVISGGSGAVTLTNAANAQDVLAFTYRASNTSCYATLGHNYN